MQRSVLIVDDSPAVLVLLRALVWREGATAVLAEGPEPALSFLKEMSVSAVISDYNMPGADEAYFDALHCSGVPTFICTGELELLPPLVTGRFEAFSKDQIQVAVKRACTFLELRLG